ncbi:MAG: hypothetical protein ACJ768_21665 [Gaiellaceae bacterium]
MARRVDATRAAFFGIWTAAIVLNLVQPSGSGWHVVRLVVSISWVVSLVALGIALIQRRRARSRT